MAETIAYKPNGVPTRETVAFLSSHVPTGAKILEVGCGDGEVAAELSRCGYDVTGLDAEAERVAKAQQLGVHAMVASWPEFHCNRVHAIAFTRSLHHIEPLDKAVEKARELLNPTGILLIEDFAFGETDRRTVEWFVKMLRADEVRSVIIPIEDELVTRLLSAKDPLAAWQESHNRALHPITTIQKAASKHFTIRRSSSAPYLYRYLVPVLPETRIATPVIERLLQEEVHAAQQNDIALMGRRIVASPKARGE